MALIDFKRVMRVVKLDKSVFKEIRGDKDALTPGLIIVAVVALITGFAQLIASVLGEMIAPTLGLMYVLAIYGIGFIASPFISIIVIFLVAILPHLFAKYVFKGKANYIDLVKAISYVEVISLLSIIMSFVGIIPVAGPIAAMLFSLLVMLIYMIYWIIAARETYEISTFAAAVSIIVPIIIYVIIIVIIAVILAAIFGLALFSMMSQEGFSSY